MKEREREREGEGRKLKEKKEKNKPGISSSFTALPSPINVIKCDAPYLNSVFLSKYPGLVFDKYTHKKR
jgi:hypothetical protein